MAVVPAGLDAGGLDLGVSVLNGAAVAAAIGVVLVLAASLTLLPALLSLAGPRIARPGRRLAAREARVAASGFCGCDGYSECSDAPR